MRLLTRASDKFGEELEVTNILNKLRNSYDIIKALKDKQNSILLKFSKERVIDAEEESEDSEEEEKKEPTDDVRAKPNSVEENLIHFSDESSFNEDVKENRRGKINQEEKIR